MVFLEVQNSSRCGSGISENFLKDSLAEVCALQALLMFIFLPMLEFMLCIVSACSCFNVFEHREMVCVAVPLLSVSTTGDSSGSAVLQALAWFGDAMVQHAETFWSLFAVDMDALLEMQPADTWDSFPLFQMLNNYLRNHGHCLLENSLI